MTESSWEFAIQEYSQFLFLFSFFVLFLVPLCLSNDPLCCHSTSNYQTSSLSHLFLLYWESFLSFYSLSIINCLQESPVSSCPRIGSCRNKQQCNMKRVKIKTDTGGSRVIILTQNVSLVATVQLRYSPIILLIKTYNAWLCLCESFM